VPYESPHFGGKEFKISRALEILLQLLEWTYSSAAPLLASGHHKAEHQPEAHHSLMDICLEKGYCILDQ
jgi:hypothetical protein